MDAALIDRARAGDMSAFESLHERNAAAALAHARGLTRSTADAEDLVAEAFTKVMEAVRRGNGPDDAFRPYLLTVVRRLAYDTTARRKREEVAPDAGEDAVIELDDPAIMHLERELVRDAFATLPERWQTVLWQTEVEGRRPQDIAPALGLSANAAAALTYRAREGLRQAYLAVHSRENSDPGCGRTLEGLPSYVRGTLGSRGERRVASHLDSCDRCLAAYVELIEINSDLRAAFPGWLLMAGASGAAGAAHVIAGSSAPAVTSTRAIASAGGKGSRVLAGSVVSIVFVALAAALVGAAWPRSEHVATARRPAHRVASSGSSRVPGRPGATPSVPVTAAPGAGPSVPATTPSTTSPAGPRRRPTPPATGLGAGGGSPVLGPISGSTGGPSGPAGGPGGSTLASAPPAVPVDPSPTTAPPSSVDPTTPPGPGTTTPPTTIPPTTGATNIPPTTSGSTTPVTAPPTTTPPTTPPPTTAPPTTPPPTTAPPTTTPVTDPPVTTVPIVPHPITVAVAPMGSLSAGQVGIVGISTGGLLAGPAAGSVTITPSGSDAFVPDPHLDGCLVLPDKAVCSLTSLSAPGSLTRFIKVQPGSGASVPLHLVYDGAGVPKPDREHELSVPVDGGSLRAKYATEGPVTVAAAGANVVTCAAAAVGCTDAQHRMGPNQRNNGWPLVYVDDDGDPSTFDSAAATLALPAGAVPIHAELVWGGSVAGGSGGLPAPSLADLGAVVLRGPNGASVPVVGDVELSTTHPGDYQVSADITGLVTVGGQYRVSNVQTGTGESAFGGWSLQVVVSSPSLPVRVASILVGSSDAPGSGGSRSLPLGGFAASGVGAQITITSWEGDPGFGTETASAFGAPLVNADNPFGDIANSSIVGQSGMNGWGFDLDQFDLSGLPDPSGRALALTGSQDEWTVGAVAVVVPRAEP